MVQLDPKLTAPQCYTFRIVTQWQRSSCKQSIMLIFNHSRLCATLDTSSSLVTMVKWFWTAKPKLVVRQLLQQPRRVHLLPLLIQPCRRFATRFWWARVYWAHSKRSALRWRPPNRSQVTPMAESRPVAQHPRPLERIGSRTEGSSRFRSFWRCRGQKISTSIKSASIAHLRSIPNQYWTISEARKTRTVWMSQEAI